MQAVIFTGLQAAGKSSFYRERFFRTHVRINMDMLRTKHREKLLLHACLEGKTPFVVDKINLTKAERAVYIGQAARFGFSAIGYYFESSRAEALRRNAGRAEDERVPDLAILGGARRLEPPTLDEGFSELYYVTLGDEGFTVERQEDEV